MQRVTWLEPRTPHQPGKLQKLSKNEVVFTPSSFRVNKKGGVLSAEKSIECSPSTAVCNISCADRAPPGLHFPSRGRILWRIFLAPERGAPAKALFSAVKIRQDSHGRPSSPQPALSSLRLYRLCSQKPLTFEDAKNRHRVECPFESGGFL